MSADALSGGGGTGEGGADAEIPASAAYRISLPDFEGPLDLLLHLCKSHEIDIVNIPVAFVTEKYLEYLDMMQSLSVDVAAEYLVMAATLAYLKARELVPSPEPLETAAEEAGEEALDPREELIRRLLEYQKYKDAAEKLGARPIEGRNIFGRGLPMEAVGDAGLAEHSVWRLIESWSKVLEQATPKAKHEVEIDRVSITDRINQIIDKMEAEGALRFEALVDLNLPEVELRHQVVVTLLAVLELAKLRVIRVLMEEETGTFYISPRAGAQLDAARRAKVTSDESGREPAAGPEADVAGGEALVPDELEDDPELAELDQTLAAAGLAAEGDLTMDDLSVDDEDEVPDAPRVDEGAAEVADESPAQPAEKRSSEEPDGST